MLLPINITVLTARQMTELRKKKTQLENDITSQVKNLRDADENLKKFIQQDIKTLTDELEETETLLSKLEDDRRNQMYAVRNIEETKDRLLHFKEFAKDANPEILVTLIQSLPDT